MMADQIKNGNLGEVSSQVAATEKATAPSKKMPTFADPKSKEGPKKLGAEGNGENLPDKNLPTFRGEEGDNTEPPAKGSVIINGKERKLPVFAAEVKQFEDDDFEDDGDGASDTIAMPVMAASATVAVDASDVAQKKGKKKKNKKANKGESMAAEVDSADDAPIVMPMPAPAPAPVSEAPIYVPAYDSAPVSAPAAAPSVPTDAGRDEASALMEYYENEKARAKVAKKAAKNAKAVNPVQAEAAPVTLEADTDIIDAAPNTQDAALVPSKKAKRVDPGIEEAKALLDFYAAEKQRNKEIRRNKRNTAAPEATGAAGTGAIIDVTDPTPAGSVVAVNAVNSAIAAENAAYLNDLARYISDAESRGEDTTPYIAELAHYMSEMSRASAPAKTLNSDPGRDEAKALLEDYKEEKH